MLWQIVNIVEIPFGKRILRRGMKGKAVRRLQEILTEHGFYSEAVDGQFGVLTEEAVMLLQKTFRLTVDGVVGPGVYQTLQRMNNKVGRIIYTVKKGESLANISQRFTVAPAAWRRMPDGRGDLKSIYPGMKLWLYRKAFFIWEEKMGANPATGNFTGVINSRLQIDSEAEIDFEPDQIEPDQYHLVQSAAEVWEKCFTSKKYCQKVAGSFKKLSNYRWGLDLRTAPFDSYPNWNGLFKLLLRHNGMKKMPLVLVPLFVSEKGVNRGFWDSLADIGDYARLIMIEPVLENTSADAFNAAVQQL
ncbi:MAG TPA: peptidoglycan-binding protein, partial [Bacillota bacterium]|nr:peptidoglycan-binding protein [Bacillota bacterium]